MTPDAAEDSPLEGSIVQMDRRQRRAAGSIPSPAVMIEAAHRDPVRRSV